jgi:hypothetical protein
MGKIRDLWRMRRAMKDFRRQQEEAGNLPTTSDMLKDSAGMLEHLSDPSTIAAIQAGAAGAYAQGSSPDPLVQLERLGALRDRGVLTEAEFQREKARLLAG